MASVVGMANVDIGSGIAAGDDFSEVKACGTVVPMETARSVLPPESVLSSHRPSQPVCTECSGTPDCQMSIDRKWLRFDCGYPTPRTMATCFLSHMDFRKGSLPLR